MEATTDKNYTKLPNELMEILMSNALSKNEIRILLFISRKTYGYHKVSDQISLSQFQSNLGLSRQGVISILKRLQLVKLCRLVNKGNSRLSSSEWLIDTSDYINKLVNIGRLPKFEAKKRNDIKRSSQVNANKLVNIGRHTKEITKESNKEAIKKNSAPLEQSGVKENLSPLTKEQRIKIALELHVDLQTVSRKEQEVLEPESIKKYKTQNIESTTRKWLRRAINEGKQQTLDENGMEVMRTLYAK